MHWQCHHTDQPIGVTTTQLEQLQRHEPSPASHPRMLPVLFAGVHERARVNVTDNETPAVVDNNLTTAPPVPHCCNVLTENEIAMCYTSAVNTGNVLAVVCNILSSALDSISLCYCIVGIYLLYSNNCFSLRSRNKLSM